eukprot:2263072-Alexandrium_andersonii.AAC.1
MLGKLKAPARQRRPSFPTKAPSWKSLVSARCEGCAERVHVAPCGCLSLIWLGRQVAASNCRAFDVN